MSTESIPWYQTCFELFESQLNGERSSSLHQVRRNAYESLLEKGLPTSKDEDWKYTDIRDVRNGDFVLASKDGVTAISDDVLNSFEIANLDSYRIVSVDGYAKPESLSALDGVEGLEIGTVSSLSSEKGSALQELFSTHYGSYAKTEDDGVAALNSAFVQDGIILHVHKNASIDKPILIDHVSLLSDQQKVSFPRILIVMEEGAEATCIEHFVTSGSGKGLTSSVTECVVAPNASLQHYQIGDEASDEHIRLSRIATSQARDSKFTTLSVAFGGRLIRNEVHPTLGGTGGFSGMYGLSVLNGKQHVDNHTILDHAEPHCESDERYKGIYDDRSKGVFCGTIIVRPDAQKTNAIQNNQGLLLSDTASLSTKPQLKIWADDVKCTHGATVGQLDKDQLFYLRSRGIGERDARNMLVQAFAGDVTQEINDQALRNYVEEKVVQKLITDSASE